MSAIVITLCSCKKRSVTFELIFASRKRVYYALRQHLSGWTTQKNNNGLLTTSIVLGALTVQIVSFIILTWTIKKDLESVSKKVTCNVFLNYAMQENQSRQSAAAIHVNVLC